MCTSGTFCPVYENAIGSSSTENTCKSFQPNAMLFCGFSRSCRPFLTKVWRLKNINLLLKVWFSSLKCMVFYWVMKPARLWPRDCSWRATLPVSGEKTPYPVVLGCTDVHLRARNKGSNFSWFSLQVTLHSQNHLQGRPSHGRAIRMAVHLSGGNDPVWKARPHHSLSIITKAV